MHITVIHHQPLSQTGLPASGASIRLGHLVDGLQQNIPNVQFSWLCKSEVIGNWKNHIWQGLQSTQTDIILCTQLQDVSILPPRDQSETPVVVDLYAPRLMESMYETDDGSSAHHIIRAIARADAYLYAHQLQLDHWQALMRLVGIANLSTRCLLTPLGIEVGSHSASKKLRLVGGGRVWPWQNPWENLSKLLSILDQKDGGEIHWFTPPNVSIPIEHPRLTIQPWTSRTAYRTVLQTAHIGLDLNPPSPERRLACAFRHMEMIGCGIPLLSTNHNILSRSAPKLCSVVDLSQSETVWKLITKWTNSPPQKAIQGLQKKQSPHTIVAALVSWLKNPQTYPPTPHYVVDSLDYIQQELDAQAQVEELQKQVDSLQQTRSEQTRLLEHANQQIQENSSSVLQMATAIENISAFKNDIAHSWSNLMHEQQQTISALQEQIQTLQADNAKKSAELAAMDQLRERLENDLKNVREELANRPQSRWR